MNDEQKNKAQLLEELRQMRERLTTLEEENRALQKNERMFRALTESMHAMVVFASAKEQRALYVNPAAAECTGYSVEELTGASPPMVLSDESLKEQLALREAYERGEPLPSRTEMEIITKTGKRRWIETSWALLDMGEDGLHKVTTSFDITERRMAEQELLANEEKYRTVFNTAGTAMVIFGDDKVITLANDEWVKVSGYSKEETEGKLTWMTFFSDETLERMKRYHEMRSQDPEAAPKAYEVRFTNRHGKVHDGILNINVIPGTLTRVASFQDMTDLKRAQHEMHRADKMAALGQIIAGIAHEINNPNNFIYFNLPILRKYIEAIRPHLEACVVENPDLELLHMPYNVFLADVYKLLENMEHGSKRITGIVSELKNYIRSDETRDFKTEDLGAVIHQIMTLVGKQVRKMVKRLDVEIDAALKPVRINAGKIEQVLINLVINAGQAADKEESWIKLTARPCPTDPQVVEIRIADNGMGIPEENLDQIFEPFFTSKSQDTGTGLGLSISHQIVEEHGGTIAVESRLGQGTTFTVCLPMGQPSR